MTSLRNYVSAVIILSFVMTYSCFSAPREQTQQREPSARQQAMAERRQQFEQEAAAAGPEIETEYNKYIGYVNSGRIPDDANVREGLKFVTKMKKFLPLLNKQNNGGTYYALSAWVSYFDNKPDKVQKQIAAGIKEGAANPNFIRTAFALSILNKDYNSVEQISDLTQKPFSEDANAPAVEASYAQPGASENTLNFDVNGIYPNLLGKDFSSLTMGSEKVIISVLLWQIDANELEHFAPPAAKSGEPNDPNNPAPPVEEQPIEQPVEQTFEPVQMPDLSAFTNLNKHFGKNPKTVFIGINFNDPSKTVNVENWLAKNPQAWQSIAPSDAVQQMVVSLLGEMPNKPMLVIAGPDSKIRYVGDVNNFLPQMIIKNILSNPKEFAEPNEANEPNAPAAVPDVNTQPQMEFLKPTPLDTNQTSTQIQSSEPNDQTIQTPVTTAPQTTTQTKVDEDFFDPRAENLLENAKAFFKIGNRMQFHTYAKPIEMCRTVIKDYPNTKYAEEARVLMRQVPERFRERYHITDAELGL